MSTPYRSLTRDELRVELNEEHFATPAAGVESFEVSIQAHPVRWIGGLPVPAPVLGEGGTHQLVTAEAGGLKVHAPGAPCGSGGGVTFGAGGAIGITAAADTPRAALELMDMTLEAAQVALGGAGIALVFTGQSPWHSPGELSSAGCQLLEPMLSLDELYGENPELGPAVLRSAGTRVRVGFGGTVQRLIRWRAAELAAPLLTGLFACSPLRSGTHDGFKSERARARQAVDRSRTGWGWPMPGAAPEGAGDAVETYLEFALGARIVGVSHGARWVSPQRPMTFEQWMEHGIEGQFPDLDDWRGHLATLDPEVAPSAGIELRGIDSVPDAFRAVPLLFIAGLLTEPGAAQAVIDRLEPTAPRWEERRAEAARGGLLDPDLAEDARWAWARASEGLLRLSPSWFTDAQLGAFVAYGRRYPLRGLTPADEILDLFIDRGQLGQRELSELNQRWCRSAGVSWAA